MATPAAGKTTLALKVAHEQLLRGEVQRVVVVAPTDHLRGQWTQAAAAVGLQLDPSLSGSRCVEARDYVGAVVTYQQVVRNPDAFAVAPSRRRTLVILDEVHHAADGKDWGTALRTAFGAATYRLALSGTPFRSDNAPIPFVTYVGGVSRADFTYGYSAAIADHVCRPMFFRTYDGTMAWQDNAGPHQHRFGDALTEIQSRRRLKTALVREPWLAPVCAAAVAMLREVRAQGHPEAGGLVVAMDQAHARWIRGLLVQYLGAPVPMAVSDDATSAATIRAFTRSRDPWLVAVRMVSEGVDIPRLRVGVYASNITTEMYFRQVVGRFVRSRRELGREQPAFLFLPQDPVLDGYARAIEEERDHVLEAALPASAPVEPTGADRTPSSFIPVQAVAGPSAAFGVGTQPSLEGWGPGAGESVPVAELESLAERKEGLRRIHASLVSDVAHKLKTDHRAVALELIKRIGGKVADATVDQLDRRIRVLEFWRDGGRYP